MKILRDYKKAGRDPEITDIRYGFQYELAKKYGWEKLSPIEQDSRLNRIGISDATLRNRPHAALQQLVKKGYIAKYTDEKDANWKKYRLKDEYDDTI